MIVHVAVGKCILNELSREITQCYILVTFMGAEKRVKIEDFRNDRNSEVPLVFNAETNVDFPLDKPSEGTNESSSIHGCKIKFQLIGANSYGREFIMCESFKVVNTSEHSISKVIDLYDATDTNTEAKECGKLTVTVYYYPAEKKSDDEFVQDVISQTANEWNEEGKTSSGWFGIFGDANDTERKNKEFEFLKARRLNWTQKKKSTFDSTKEKEVGNDPVVKLKEEYGQGKIAMRIMRRKEAIKCGEDYLKKPFQTNPVKNPERRTIMGVGFSNNFWPVPWWEAQVDNGGEADDEAPPHKPPLPMVPIRKHQKSRKLKQAANAAHGVVGVAAAAKQANYRPKRNPKSKPKSQIKVSSSVVLMHRDQSIIKSDTKEVLKSLAEDARKSREASDGKLPTALKEREKQARIKLRKNLYEKENDIKTLQNQILHLKRISSAKIKQLEEKYERAKRAAAADPPSKSQKARINANPDTHMESVFRFLQPTKNMKKARDPSASLTASTTSTQIKQKYPLRSGPSKPRQKSKEDNFGDIFYSKTSRRKSKENVDDRATASPRLSNVTTRKASKGKKTKTVEEVLKQNRYRKNFIRNGGRSTLHSIGGSQSGAPTRKPAKTLSVSRAKSVLSLDEKINRQSPPKTSRHEFYQEVAKKLAGEDVIKSRSPKNVTPDELTAKESTLSSSTTPVKGSMATLDDLNKELNEIYITLSAQKSSDEPIEAAKMDLLNDRVDSILEEVQNTQRSLYADEDMSIDENLKELTAYMEGSVDKESRSTNSTVEEMDEEFLVDFDDDYDAEHVKQVTGDNRESFGSEISH